MHPNIMYTLGDRRRNRSARRSPRVYTTHGSAARNQSLKTY